MANNNLKAFTQKALQYGIMGQIIPLEKNPNQVGLFIYNGKEYRPSQLYGRKIDQFFKDIKDDVACESVAKQKISTAHGTNAEQMAENYVKQLMTYADGIGSNIQLKGQPLYDSINWLFEQKAEILKTQNWVSCMIDIHAYNDYDEPIKNGMAIAKAKVYELLNTKQVIEVNGYIYSVYAISQLIKNWFGENDIQTCKKAIDKITNEVIDRVTL